MTVSDVGRTSCGAGQGGQKLKKDIPWISVSAFGMFLGSPTDIQMIGPMSEIDIFWTSTGLTCVMWGGQLNTEHNRNFGEFGALIGFSSLS